MNLKIYIPTKGRVSNQLTYTNLPREIRQITTFVCPSRERVHHLNNWMDAKVLVQPDDNMGIAEKRGWILRQAHENGEDKIVMLDDDLRFAVRRDDDPARFRKAEVADVIQAFIELDEVLSEDVPHAGFSARGGGISDAAQEGGWQEGKRMMYVLGYHVPTVLREAEFGRLSTHEDMDVCLQLLTKGFANKVNYTFVVDQKFGNPGGCTNERTVETNNADCYRLASFFPAYVRVSEKNYAGSVPRVEVVCQWARALRDARGF